MSQTRGMSPSTIDDALWTLGVDAAIAAREKAGRTLQELSGYLGEAQGDSVRLYADKTAATYVEFPKAEIVHIERESDDGNRRVRVFLRDELRISEVSRRVTTAGSSLCAVRDSLTVALGHSALGRIEALEPIRPIRPRDCRRECEGQFAAAASMVFRLRARARAIGVRQPQIANLLTRRSDSAGTRGCRHADRLPAELSSVTAHSLDPGSRQPVGRAISAFRRKDETMHSKHLDSSANFTQRVAAWVSGATACVALSSVLALAVAFLTGCGRPDGFVLQSGPVSAVADQFPVVAVDGSGQAFILARGRTNDPLLTQQRTHPFASTYEFATGVLSSSTDLATVGGTVQTLIAGFDFAIATDGSGHGTALWMSSGGLYASQFNRDAGWRRATQLSEASDITQYRVAMDGFGRSLAVWVESGDGGGRDLFARHSPFPSDPVSGNPWEDVRLVRQAPGLGLGLGGVVYQGFRGYAVWREPSPTNSSEGFLEDATFTGNQGWGLPLPLRTTVPLHTPPPVVAWHRASSEGPIAVWEESGRLGSAVGSTWRGGIPRSDGGRRPHMAMAANLETVVVWEGEAPAFGAIFASRFVDGSWEPAERINNSGASAARSPRVATDATGNAIAVWSDGSSVRVSRYLRGTGWEGEREIGTDRMTEPEIAMDDSGRAIVVWEAIDPNQTSSTIIARVASPTITLHPSNVEIVAGANATFSCFAVGNARIDSPFMTHQWQRLDAGGSAWNNIANATDRSYTLVNAQSSDNGARFRCRASTGLGEAVSNGALLTVTPGIGGGRAWHPLGGPLNVLPVPSHIVGAPAVEHDALDRPVVAFTECVETCSLYVRRYAGNNSWHLLGAALDVTPGLVSGLPSLAIDRASGDVYVAWQEAEDEFGRNSGVYVKRWSGNAWTLIGAGVIDHEPAAFASSPALRVRNGQPIVAWLESDRLVVKGWTGTAWAALGTELGPEGGAVGLFSAVPQLLLGGVPLADRPIVAWLSTNGDVLVSQNVNAAWAQLSPAPLTNAFNDRIALGLDGTDRPIVANASTALNQFQVRRFDNGQWLPMGFPLGTASGGGFLQGIFGLAFSRTPSPASTLVAWSHRVDSSFHAASWDGQSWQPLGSGIRAVGRLGPGFNGEVALVDGATPTMAYVVTSQSSDGSLVDRALYVSQFR